MSRPTRIAMLALLLCFFCLLIPAQAQDDPYADLPQARTADGAFVLGEPSAPVKLIEFSDFLCTSCQNYKPIISSFIAEYVRSGQAQFEYRILPVIDAELSALSGSLVECADTLQPGAFWRAHDLMFEIVSAQGFTAETMAQFASTLELDIDALGDCAAAATQYAVDATYGASLGVRSAPALFLQYGTAEPIQIALALPEHYPAIVKATLPQSSETVTIEHGRYAGLTTYRAADGGFVLGEPTAPLTIVAFEDFLCPHCQSYQSILHSFIDEHVRGGQAQFEYRLYPLVNPQFSTAMAKIAECVAAQDLAAFWDAHDLLFEFAGAGNLENMAANLANLLALDAEALVTCQDRAMQFLIDTNVGQSAGVSGTPAIRARDQAGALQTIYVDGRPLDRGGLPLAVLAALAADAPNISIGPPAVKLLEDDSLITGEPCAPPCWQNIVPGETSMTEALEIVNGLEGSAIFESSEDDFIFGLENSPCCLIRGADTVAMILLQLAPQTSLSQVIEHYGEPPQVTGERLDANYVSLMFYYPEQRMVLYSLLAGADPQLEESSPITNVIYGSEDFFANTFPAGPYDYWKGYLSYSEYMDGEYDYEP